MANPDLTSILCLYPVLATLSRYLSALDLYHTAQANKTCLTYIQLGSDTFSLLCRENVCDGRGLLARQEYREPFYHSRNIRKETPRYPGVFDDDQIEVNVWAVKCDEVNALPCRRCGMNICEECRCLDRVALKAGKLQRLPYPDNNGEHGNFFAQCPTCDDATEKEIEGQFLNAECDCDEWTHWVCIKCALEERKISDKYFLAHVGDGPDGGPEMFEDDLDAGEITQEEYDEAMKDWNETKIIGGHQQTHKLYCTCGAPVPHEMRTRCTWCRRKHLPEELLYAKLKEFGIGRSTLGNAESAPDPTYPRWCYETTTAYNRGEYPSLPYDGPIWTEEERRTHVAGLQRN